MYLIELKNCKHFIKSCVHGFISPSLSHFEALKPEKEPPDIFSGQYPLKMVGLNGQWSSKKQCCPIWGLNKNVSIFLILFSSSVHWNKRKEFVKFQRHVHFSGPCDFYKKKTLFRSAKFDDFWNWTHKNIRYLLGSNVSNLEEVLNHFTL